MDILAQSTEPVPLVLRFSPATAGLYPQALLYDESWALLDTVDLSDVGTGALYTASWTVPSSDKFIIDFRVFGDAGHSDDISDRYELTADLIIADQPTAQPPPLVGSGTRCGAP